MRAEQWVGVASGALNAWAGKDGVIEHTYDPDNRLIAKGAQTLDRDANGNLMQETGGDEKTYYSYSADNRMTQVKKPVDQQENSLKIADFRYDALGRRIERKKYEMHNGRYQYDDLSLYGYSGLDLEVAVNHQYKLNGQEYRSRRVKENLYFSALTVAQRHSDQQGAFAANDVRYLYQDALGSVTTVAKSGGNEILRYGAWGEFLDTNYHNQRREEFTNFDTEFGYTGKPYDGFTRNYNYGYREYNPNLKQWYTEDPIRDGYNWYAYLGGVGDPVNFIDPNGLRTHYISGVPVNYPSMMYDIIDAAEQKFYKSVDEVSSNFPQKITVNDVDTPDAQVYLWSKLPGGGGVSLGDTIIVANIAEDNNIATHAAMLQHEYGHFLQNQRIGALNYAFNVAVPSLFSAMINTPGVHSQQSYEMDANFMAIQFYGPQSDIAFLSSITSDYSAQEKTDFVDLTNSISNQNISQVNLSLQYIVQNNLATGINVGGKNN